MSNLPVKWKVVGVIERFETTIVNENTAFDWEREIILVSSYWSF